MKLRDGSEVRGKIVESDVDTVSLGTSENPRPVKRTEIVDASFPGETEMIAGTLTMIAGGMTLLLVDNWTGGNESVYGCDCSWEPDYPKIIAGTTLLFTGGGLVAIGAINHESAASRYRPRRPAAP